MTSEKAKTPEHPLAASSHSSLHDDQLSKEHLAEESTTSGPPAAQAGDVEAKAGDAPGSAPTAGQKSDVNHMASVPNGGLTAWLQVAGSFALFFNTWGIINTWGIYQTYYEIDILKGLAPSTIAWVGSLQAFLLMFVGAICGPIYDAGGFRILVIVGSFLVVFGHMMLSLCTEFWQVLLAQGFCVGIGMGALFVPSVAILSTYFTTKLAGATGIAASGSSLGGVLYPIILHRLIPRIGFPWAVRTIGFIALATLLVPNIVMQVRVLPPARRKLIDKTAFTDKAFLAFCLSCFIIFLGLFQPFFYVQSFALAKKITNENLAFYLLSILNTASIFGRIIPNIVANKIGPLNVITPCAVMTGVLILSLLGVTNLGGLIVVILLFGFFSGSLVSLPPTIVVHLTPDRRFIGTRMGMCFMFNSIAVLVSTPIGGALIKISNDYWRTWVFGGVLATIGGASLVLSRGFHKGWQLKVKA